MAEEDPPEKVDCVLLQRLKDGDAAAFWEIWERHKKRLFGICCKMLEGRMADAEEALDTVMVRAWAALPCSEVGNLKPWLNAVTRNTCLEIQRGNRWEVMGIEYDKPEARRESPSNEPGEMAARSARDTQLLRSIDRLPRNLREPFKLRHIDQMSYCDIAKHLEISVGNARHRVYRAILQLRPEAADETPIFQHMWDIRARMAQVRLASVRLPNGATVSYRLHFEEPLPYRMVRIETLRKYVANHPNGWSMRLDLANLLGAAGKWEEAVEHLRAVLDRTPEQIHLWMRLGEILRGLQRPSEASDAYRHALDLTNTPAGRLHIQGWIALCDGFVDRALESLRQASALEPRNSAHWHAIGFISRDALRHTESADAFEHALALDPRDIVALVGSHDSLLHLCRYKEIMDRLTRAVAIDGNDVLALKLLVVHRSWWGYVWGQEGKRTKRLAERAIRIAPDTSETCEALANYHTARGERSMVLKAWENYLGRNNGDARALRLYAADLLAVGRSSEAISALRRGAQLAPTDYLAQGCLCRALAEFGYVDEAKRMIPGLLERFSDVWDCHTRCGYMLCAWLGEPDRGCEMARYATELQPDLPDTHLYYGDVLRKAGRLQEAISAYVRAWAKSPLPRQPDRTRCIGQVCREMGDEIQAKDWFRRALEDADAMHDWNPTLGCLFRGQALEALGDTEGAICAYQSALNIGFMLHDHRKQARDAIKCLRRQRAAVIEMLLPSN